MDSQATFTVTLTQIWQKLVDIEALLEKQNPTPPLAGWVGSPPDRNQNAGTSQPANESGLIDFCKRIEFCFKDKETDFIDFRATRNLVNRIVLEHGPECLRQFTRFCEDRCETMGNRAIARPERMTAFFEKWIDTFGE